MEALNFLLCLLLTAYQANTIGSWTTGDWLYTTEVPSEPCGDYLTDWMGEFFSPRYPNSYPDNARCTWTIHSTGGTTVLLTFTDVYLETCCDYIRVYDGPSTLYPLLDEIRDYKNKRYNSSNNDLTVLFYSDGSISRRGFHANWVFVDSNSCRHNCGRSLGSCSCNDSCQDNRNCCYDYDSYCSETTIETTTAATTTFWIETTAPSCRYNCGHDFYRCSCTYDCQYYGNCCPDYDSYCFMTTTQPPETTTEFIIDEGSCKNNCGVLLPICGCDDLCQNYNDCCPDYDSYCSHTPGPTTWPTTVTHSCLYNCGYNFSSCSCTHDCQYYGNCCHDFHWYCPSDTTESHPQCGGHLYGSGLFSSPNYPNYYHDNAYCVWYLSAQHGQRIFLSFVDVQLERCCNCDYISVYDGSSTGYPQLGKICFNDTTNQVLHSSSRYLTVVFRSDYSGVSHGFKALFTSSLTADQGRVDCSSDNMVIVIQRSYLNSLGYSGNDLYVDDHLCRPTITSYEVVFSFPLDTCGTAKEMMNGYVSFTNNVRASQSQSGEITRQSQFLLHVGCRMEPDTIVQIFYRAKEIIDANITGTGRFNASIAFYTSSGFYQQIYDSPYEVDLNQYLYVQVKLNRPDNSLDLFLDTCVASPNPSDFKDRSYDLLRNGCPRDNTYYSYTSGQHYYAQFRFRAFKFLRTHAYVYLQCKVIICPDNDYNSRCRQGCRFRRKRSLDSTYHTNTVTLGPIKLKGRRLDVESEKSKE
ncbi:deleted in malignant brain tumors 1 protein-like isoform X14 [Ctenopharyngodon idella]|uniref:deleted in malignant brain tumors 1 protein-like isoform X14 n=1 Tax=Ctenopharyngodon idella TaxID=7959 RepID=UPI0022311E77|nr:deleted in malignant brain tumors 1 protein-like isoform X14 [Ctenopharyngodon idella]